jgi:gamma-glutamyl:cysteine ligase YbdK (ATP-grasp superfamily)
VNDELVTRLREWAARLGDRAALDAAKDFTGAIEEIERVTEERDSTIRELRKVEADLNEARRQLCNELWLSRGGQCSVESIAEARGWDCFKEEP